MGSATPLYDAAKAENAAGFGLAYDRYAPVLYGLLLRLLGDAEDAQEALQETFLEAWSNAGSYDEARGNELEWLITMARRRSIGAASAEEVALGAGQVAPPPAVRTALMRKIDRESTVRTLERPAPRRRSWLAAIAAVLLLAAYFITSAQLRRTREAMKRLESEVAQLRTERQKLSEKVTTLAAPETKMMRLTGQAIAPDASASVFLDTAKRSAFLFFEDLPPNPRTKSYQLWILRTDQAAPQNAGVFDVDRSGKASLVLQNLPEETAIRALAVTLEPKGGAPAPTGEKYLTGM